MLPSAWPQGMDDFDVSERAAAFLEDDVDWRIHADDRSLQHAAAELRADAIPNAVERQSPIHRGVTGLGIRSHPTRRSSQDRSGRQCCRRARCLRGVRGSPPEYSVSKKSKRATARVPRPRARWASCRSREEIPPRDRSRDRPGQGTPISSPNAARNWASAELSGNRARNNSA